MVDFLYFSDCGIPEKTYPNTKFFEIDFQSYCKRVSVALDIDFNSKYGAYKLCDCRPFYGIIHKDELIGYDYWGWADIDLIYGDLSYMLNEKNYKNYDFISAHSERVAGHFTVMRNSERYNTACLKIYKWKEKLASNKFYGLDESSEYGCIINPCNRFIGFAYWRLFRFFFKKNLYRYYDFAEWLTQPMHKKSLFKERYTTPIPNPEVPYYYNLSNGDIVVPCEQWYKMPSNGGKIYLHFLFFKRTQYRKTDTYWRNGFYKIPRGFNFDNEIGMIKISTESIEFVSN